MDNISVIQTKIINYEKIEGAWAKVYTEPNMGTLIMLSNLFGNMKPEDEDKINDEVVKKMPEMFPLLTKFIKEWNFIDEDGANLPITEEVVERLPYDIQVWLLNEFIQTLNSTKNQEEDKKKELPKN